MQHYLIRRKIKASFGRIGIFIRSSIYPLFSAFIGFTIDKNVLDSSALFSHLSFLRGLPSNHNYFVLHASYCDKWLILSFLVPHFNLYPASRVIADKMDRPLVEIFFDRHDVASRFVFIDSKKLAKLNSFFGPKSRLSAQLIDWSEVDCALTISPYLLKNGLPPQALRSLHLIYYPYFMELMNLHGVTYGVLLRTILYLPSHAKPACPRFYDASHTERTYQLLAQCKNAESILEDNKPVVLVNPVNFSHEGLTNDQLESLIATTKSNGFTVLLNYAHGAYSDAIHELSRNSNSVHIVSIPPDLLALVSSFACATIGVQGGGIGVSTIFGKSHSLSLQTAAKFVGCDFESYLGGWSGERFWEWIHQDWPCILEGRVIINEPIPDIAKFSCDQLECLLQHFFDSIKTSKAQSYFLKNSNNFQFQ